MSHQALRLLSPRRGNILFNVICCRETRSNHASHLFGQTSIHSIPRINLAPQYPAFRYNAQEAIKRKKQLKAPPSSVPFLCRASPSACSSTRRSPSCSPPSSWRGSPASSVSASREEAWTVSAGVSPLYVQGGRDSTPWDIFCWH